MSTLVVKSKIFSLRGKFWVTDELENPRYQVKGSFLKLPKYFEIFDKDGNQRAKITHKIFGILPKFYVEIDGEQIALISKKWSLLRPKYEVQAKNLQIVGDIWDLNFQIKRGNEVIGQINRALFSIREKYAIDIFSDEAELLVLGIVLAIDYARRIEKAAETSVSMN